MDEEASQLSVTIGGSQRFEVEFQVASFFVDVDSVMPWECRHFRLLLLIWKITQMVPSTLRDKRRLFLLSFDFLQRVLTSHNSEPLHYLSLYLKQLLGRTHST